MSAVGFLRSQPLMTDGKESRIVPSMGQAEDQSRGRGMSKRTITISLVLIAWVASLAVGPPAQTSPLAATGDEIERATGDGIAWLASQQETDPGSSDYGAWAAGWEGTAQTGFALVKLQERAHDLGYPSPFDPAYPYSGHVVRGWQYLFGGPYVYKETLSAQMHDGRADDADSNGNGYGLYFESPREGDDEPKPTYSTGICLMALASSGTPSRPNDGGLDFNGDGRVDSFREIAQEAVEWLAFAQVDSGDCEGGWNYTAEDNSGARADNSNGGYAVLGLAYAEEFGCTVPDWVRSELDLWIDHVQSDAEDDTHGGAGYTDAYDGVNLLKTGNLTFQMAFMGDGPATQRFQDALDYIDRHWQDQGNVPGWGCPGWGYNNTFPASYQAIYCLMKGLAYSGIERIDTDGDGQRDDDWYNQQPPASPPEDLASYLVARQNSDGSWSGGTYGGHILSTVWALLTLEKAAPTTPTQVERCYCSEPGDLIYGIDGSSFYGYEKDSASVSDLIHVSSPPAPEGWNQPGYVPDSLWQPGVAVWWDDWAYWGHTVPECQIIGLPGAGGRPEGLDKTTHLYRRVFDLRPPERGMRVTRAVLQMWSDNKTAWWWQGALIADSREQYVGDVELFPGHVDPTGGTYALAIQNSNDRMRVENPQGTCFRLCVTWTSWGAARLQVTLPLILRGGH